MANHSMVVEGRKSCITIQLLNNTTTSKTMLVFGRDHQAPLTPAIVEEAWQIVWVGPQGNVFFKYPEDTSVGAYYTREDGSQVNIGPYPAKPGTTWNCNMNTQYDDGTIDMDSKLKLKYKIISHGIDDCVTWLNYLIPIEVFRCLQTIHSKY